MGLVINHNLMAMNTARNLSTAYGRLAISTQRLSSGLRVNSGADDAAGLAVREQMRADIAVINQGVRNAGDAISMIQTADGALSVIDEKLIRMKELAEQAATGTYSTAQRLIMDGEYQAMAAEIDRIANATDFNGVKLVDGSLSGVGMKIHFGTGNESAEDYYYISMNDMRATSTTGLQVGGGATAEVITATTGFSGVTSAISGGYFAYYYNADGSDTSTIDALDLAGFYQVTSGQTLSALVNQVNLGTAARLVGTVDAVDMAVAQNSFIIGGTHVLVTSAAATVTSNQVVVSMAGANAATVVQSGIMSAINAAPGANVWAVSGTSATEILYFARDPGVAGNNLSAYEANSTAAFLSLASDASGTLLNGGATWATAEIHQSLTDNHYYLRLSGADRGADYNIEVTDPDALTLGFTHDGVAGEIFVTDAQFNSTTAASGTGNWAGADILTQESAQEALDQIGLAINTKDSQRATLGAMQNRFQNTITNLQIQAENTQAAESRISDVDVATEMTNFTRNSILTQAATAMLAQANGFSRLALQLLGGGGGGI